MPSKFYKYKTNIIFYLTRKHEWAKKDAQAWIRENEEEIRELWNKPLSPVNTARLIAAVKEKDD